MLDIDSSFSSIEPRFLETLIAKATVCSHVSEELDAFLEMQVKRREDHPTKETSTLSLLQAIWQRINPPGTAEAARSRAMTVIDKVVLAGHHDLEVSSTD